MLLPLDALCQSQSHLPSRVQSPGPFKPYNSAFCLVIMQLTPAPIIRLCLSDSGSNYSALLKRVVGVFLTPSGSQVNAWSLSRTAYKCKTLRSDELTSSANSTSKQYHNALLPLSLSIISWNVFAHCCLPMLLPLDALCQSQSHLPSRVQSPGPFKPYNSAFCLVIMQLTPAPIIQLCLSVWLVFS